MKFEEVLLEAPTPQWSAKLKEYVCQHRKRFQELLQLFLNHKSNDYRLNQRATLIILEVEKAQPQWVKDAVPSMVKSLSANLPVAYKRNLLRILQNHTIPEHLWGHAADQCFGFLSDPSEPVAVKVFSMTVLHNLTNEIPEITRELKILIEDQFPYSSPGFKSRGRKILNAIQKRGY